MRIGIDARFYGPIGKGLGRYTQKLIENLEKISAQAGSGDAQNEYFIFLKEENFEEYRPQNKNFHKILADYRWYTFSEQINMPRLLNKFKLDLVHFPHFNVPLLYRKKFVITIHDLILVHFPTIRGTTLNPIFYWLKFLAYKIVIKFAIQRAQKIIAVSQFTKTDILKHYSSKTEKIAVTYEAVDDLAQLSPGREAEILKKYGIIKPYVVYVGNVYPHKNADNLASGFDLARRGELKNLTLVFIGADDYFYRRLKEFVRVKKIQSIIFTGRVGDEELGLLLTNSSCYARPSFYEGFELPPLEAMLLEVPVICSDHAAAREILGDSVLYFNPADINSISGAITKIMADRDLRLKMIAAGRAQVRKYSWNKMAKETMDIYLNSAIS